MHLLLALLFAPALEFPPTHPASIAHWELACTYSECGDLEIPMVIFDEMWPELGFYHFNTRVVFVTDECLGRVADKVKCSAIVLHEMTHYIVDWNEGIEDACESEGRAWDVYNAYVMEQKRYDLVRENWQESYPKCAKSQADSTSSGTQ
jgi:hypothetical protein